MSALDPALLEAAGFTGASAGQSVNSAQAKGAINTNQLNLQGEQARQGIKDQAESSGMLRSTMTSRDLGYQTADQNNSQQLIDLGVNDTIAGASIDVMQQLAQQQAQQEAQAQQKSMFDAQQALQWQQLDLEARKAGLPIDYEKVSQTTGGKVTGPGSTVSNRGW